MEQRELETNQKKDKGFTLIELLIVIVILGILATVVVFAVGGIRDSADDSVCQTRKSEVSTAAEAFLASEVSTHTGPETITIAELFAADLLNTDTVTIGANSYTGTDTVADVTMDSGCP